MKILLVYATYSNSTLMASEVLKEELESAGHTVQLVQVRDSQPKTWSEHDLVILASPSWDFNGQQGLYHEDYEDLKNRLGDMTLLGQRMAIMGLGDHTFTYYCGCVDHLEEMVQKLQAKLVIPSLKLDQYYLNEATCQKQIREWARVLISRMA